MKESIPYMIEALCFEFGRGFPEKNEENFDGEDWFNLSYYDFHFTFREITLRSSGDPDGPYKDRILYNGSLVYESKYEYIKDEGFPDLDVVVYIPGEWGEIFYEQYRRLPVHSR